MRHSKWILGVLLLAACDGTMVETDAGSDAGMQDIDSGPPLCGGAVCDAEQGCVGGVCVEICSASDTELDAALGDGVTVVRNICNSNAGAIGINAGGEVFETQQAPLDPNIIVSLFQWGDTIDVATSSISLQVAATNVDTMLADLYLGGYLELNATHALYGYTTGAAGAPGQVLATTIADGAVTEVDAPGNFDAAWLDATRFVVNGMGLDALAAGQGLYVGDIAGAMPTAVQIASGPGDYSGSVAITADFVIAGGAVDGTFENVVFAVSRADFDAALTAGEVIDLGTDARATAVLAPDGSALSASTFALVDGRLVVLPFTGDITAYTIAFDGTDVTLSEAQVLATNPATGQTFRDVFSAGGGRLVLVHAGGELVVQP